jgi:hypothetical protein
MHPFITEISARKNSKQGEWKFSPSQFYELIYRQIAQHGGR